MPFYLNVIIPLAVVCAIIFFCINPLKYKKGKRRLAAVVVFMGVTVFCTVILFISIVVSWMVMSWM